MSRWVFASAISGNCSRPRDDPVYLQLPGQFRAELHDRFLAPLIRSRLQHSPSRFSAAAHDPPKPQFSIGSSILAVFGLRMAGSPAPSWR